MALLAEKPDNVSGLAYLPAAQQMGDRLFWEVVTYNAGGRPISSETQVQPAGEKDKQRQHDP